jgi:hypothetical protein
MPEHILPTDAKQETPGRVNGESEDMSFIFQYKISFNSHLLHQTEKAEEKK